MKRYRIRIVSGEFNVKLEKENIFRETIGHHRHHDITSENGVIDSVSDGGLIVKSNVPT